MVSIAYSDVVRCGILGLCLSLVVRCASYFAHPSPACGRLCQDLQSHVGQCYQLTGLTETQDALEAPGTAYVGNQGSPVSSSGDAPNSNQLHGQDALQDPHYLVGREETSTLPPQENVRAVMRAVIAMMMVSTSCHGNQRHFGRPEDEQNGTQISCAWLTLFVFKKLTVSRKASWLWLRDGSS